MSWSALIGCVWLVLVSAVAFMPYPRHRPYALAMLLVLPFLLVAIAVEHRLVWVAIFFLGALSIYRYPAVFLARWIRWLVFGATVDMAAGPDGRGAGRDA